MKTAFIAFMVLLFSSYTSAQESFRLMFYNVLNFPNQNYPPNRISHLTTILSDYQPDIFMICELNNEAGANAIVTSMQQNIRTSFVRANFVENTSDDTIGNQNDLQNMVFFDSNKFTLQMQTEITTIYRDFNHYRFLLQTINQTTNPVYLDVIIGHLKSSSGTVNQQYRLQMAQDLTNYLNTLPATSNVILAGDLNLYTSSEPALVEFLDTTNSIPFEDPANRLGSWHNNTSYIDVFTQATRTTSTMGGASGGFDDRFDFILTSTTLQQPNTTLYYKPNTYQVYGNNSNINCYNNAINSSFCAEDNNANTPDFSQPIRDALYNFSDHLPVTLQLETTENMLHTTDVASANFYEIIGKNIVTSNLYLRVKNRTLINSTFAIYNTLGQVVQSFSIKNTQPQTINVSNLSSGLYYIINSKFKAETLKFVKIH